MDEKAGNNVYGDLIAPQGLRYVSDALAPLIGDARASLYVSQFNGKETLRFSTEIANFESMPLEVQGHHFLNGHVIGTIDEVARFVEAMSKHLSDTSIQHRFEIYVDDRLLRRLPGE